MTRPQRAVVFGANGQDGSYLVDHLVAAGWNVVGVGRQATAHSWGVHSPSYRYVSCDIADQHKVFDLLSDTSPDHVFHAAATHGMAGFVYENVWDQVLQVNTQSVLAILEYARRNPGCGICYISSSKVFGLVDGQRIDELSTKHSTCLYTISKNTSHDLIAFYRAQHGISASVVWTFNHESPRRGAEYFIPRLAHALVSAELNPRHQAKFERLGFWGNWGSASEYMKILVNLAERQVFDDFILASPHTVWAEHLVEELFAARQLDWRKHICVKAPSSGLLTQPFSVDLSKIQALNGQLPKLGASEVTEEIASALRRQAV